MTTEHHRFEADPFDFQPYPSCTCGAREGDAVHFVDPADVTVTEPGFVTGIDKKEGEDG
jgi:hypothetical protein